MRKQSRNKGLKSKNAHQTMEFARRLALKYPTGGIICLYGDLGTGKTVFAKGFASALGISENEIKSPTYTLLRSYRLKEGFLHHFDFYRLEMGDDLLSYELEEMFKQKKSWFIIEWADRIKELLPEKRVDIEFLFAGENTRIITIK